MRLVKRVFFYKHSQFQKLEKHTQAFYKSVFFYNIINPIFILFINAFLWRQTEDILTLVIFNLASWCFLPIGFYCNGHLLRAFSVKKLYFAGTVLRASLIALLIFFPVQSLSGIVFFGMGYGATSGLFFSNKNLLTLELTNSTNRIYFSSLDFISQTFNNILIPVAIGALLVFGTNHALYTPQQGYYGVAILMVVISVLLSVVIKKIHIKTADVSNIVLRRGTHLWNNARAITILLGMVMGFFSLLPVILVMQYVGQEDTLGIVQSIAAVASGVVMYHIARTINNKFRIPMITLSVALLLTASLILAVFFNTYGIFIFIALMTIAMQVLLTETNSLILDLVDHEAPNNKDKYMYVFDLELVLNVGRIIGILFFFLYIISFSEEFAVRFTPLFFALTHIVIITLAKTIEQARHVRATHLKPAQSFSHHQTPNMLQ